MPPIPDRETGFGPHRMLVGYAAFFAAVYGYARLSEFLGGPGAHLFHTQWLELAFLVYLYWLLYSIQRPWRGRGLIAASPALLGYLAHDLYYLFYGKVLRLIEVQELPELVQVLPSGQAALLVAALILPPVAILANTDRRKLRTLVAGAAPLGALILAVEFTPNAYASAFEAIAPEIVKYSDRMSVENNGRYAMLLYREAQRVAARERTAVYRDRTAYDQRAADQATQVRLHGNRRNVHLIVLESFLDPELFRAARFSRSPAHPEFKRLFGDTPGLSLSPVFGGATAQAEFELLCGVPALEQLAGVEFNVFTGAAAHCLPGLLAQADYRAIATNAYKPDFFNTLPAYQGMGFGETYFPREYVANKDTYLSTGDPGAEEYAFDDPLFEQNLAFVENALEANPDQPLFNYVLTIYGHTPHLIDQGKRPEVIRMQSDYADDHLQRAANQYYYRTEAIARYVRGLVEIDPRSLIVLISDHVPPLRNGPNTYRELRYLDGIEDHYYYNRVLVLENGKPVRPAAMHHYDLPDLVLDYLMDGRYCGSEKCLYSQEPRRKSRSDFLASYLSLLAHAAE